ncbi:hypothetical protein Tco_1180964 [Tanacetum coccineum]
MPTEPSRIAYSPSLDVDLAPTNSETESDEEVPGINAGDQDEGQAPGVQDEGQARQTLVYKMKAKLDQTLVMLQSLNLNQENLKLPTEDQVILKDPTSSTGTLSSLQNLDKELSFTNQFLKEKPQEDEPEKTNTESEVRSMVTIPIHQDTSSAPPMATLVIDLTISHPVSTIVHAPLLT